MRLTALLLTGALAGSCAQVTPPPAPPAIDRDRLLNDLRLLSADDMGGREVGSPGSAKARALIVQRFASAGLSFAGSASGYEIPFSFTPRGRSLPITGVNVVGKVLGRRQPARHIVISAHYDHLGIKNGQIFNGADDNASGTAAILEIAHYFATHPPDHSLLFVAFDAEEEGLYGSRAFVAAPPVARGSLALTLNLDMIGRDPHNTLFVVGTATQPSLIPPIERVAAKAPVKLIPGHDRRTANSADNWVEDSDHFPFMEAKIPALLFSVEDYAQHHSPTDDYETMNHEFYLRVVETMIAVVQEFDREKR